MSVMPVSSPTAALAASGEISDSELVRSAQGGDARAFDQLVTRYRGKVFGMCQHLVQNEQDAWDLAQEAFIKAWRALPAFKLDSAFYTWLYRIAHNCTYDWLRKRRIQGDGEFDETRQGEVAAGAETAPHSEARPDQMLKNRELGTRIKEAMTQLTPEHRAVVLLREVEGLSYEEIAHITNSQTGTVMSRLFYARKRLQELLKDAREAHENA
jgi:RNA polymerase sigma-70 factor (ECF subfamily)